MLYWELYDNEGTSEKPGGFWLIDERNQKQPIWHTHRRYFEWARQHVHEVTVKSGSPPDEAAFRREAAAYLRQELGKLRP